MTSPSTKLKATKGTQMNLNKVVKIADDVGVIICGGKWITWHRYEGEWVHDLMDAMLDYALDVCALHLHSAEAFILVIALDLGDDISTFDDKAVREVIRQANLDWEFVE